MPDREKIKLLYDTFSSEYDLGTQDDFAQKLQDESKRKAFYDAVSQEYDLGDYQSFSNKVSLKKKDETISEPSTTTAEVSVSEAPSTERASEPYLQQPQQEFMAREQFNRFHVLGQTEPKPITIDEKYAERQRVQREVKQQNEKVAYNSGKTLLYNNINKDYLSLTQDEIDETLNTVSAAMMKGYGIGLSAPMRQQLESEWRNKSDVSTAKVYYENVSPEIIGEFLPQEELINFSTTKAKPTPRTFTQMQEAYVVNNIFTPEQTRLFAAIKSGNKELADQLRGTPNLYDPVTGKLTEEPTKETAKYEYEVDQLVDEYVKTSKDNLEDLFLTKSAVYRTLKDRRNATLFGEQKLGWPEVVPVIEDLEEKLKVARKELDAASRAFMLNQDPAYVETGIMERLTGYGDVVDLITTSESLSPTEYQKVYEQIAPLFDVPLTDTQKKEFEDTFTEKAIDAFSETIPIMAKIGVASVALNKIGATRGIAKVVKDIEKNYGKYAEFVASLAANSAVQTATFTYAGQGYETALGEAFGEKAIETIISPIVGKYGKLANALIKMGGGNIGEFVAEYSGELLSSLADSNINVEQAFEQTFGRTYDEGKDKALLTFFMTTMFSGAANLPNVGGAVIDLIYSQPEVNSNKDAQKMYDEYKKGVTLSSTVSTARGTVNKIDRGIGITENEKTESVAQLEKAIAEADGMELPDAQKEQIKQSLQNNIKKIQDAIQKPSTEEVDVRQQTEDGETVGEQDTQEITTEEGAQITEEKVTDETEQITTEEQPMLEGVQTSGIEEQGGQESTELRTETETTEEAGQLEAEKIDDDADIPIGEDGKFVYRKTGAGYDLVNSKTGKSASPSTKKNKIVDIFFAMRDKWKRKKRDDRMREDEFVSDVLNEENPSPLDILDAIISHSSVSDPVTKENIIEDKILEIIGNGVSKKDFATYSDSNLLEGIRTSFVRQGAKSDLDIRVRSLGEELGITVEDVIKFIEKHKNKEGYLGTREDATIIDLSMRFREATGLPITPELVGEYLKAQADADAKFEGFINEIINGKPLSQQEIEGLYAEYEASQRTITSESSNGKGETKADTGGTDQGQEVGVDIVSEPTAEAEPVVEQPKTGKEGAKQKLKDKWKAAQDFRGVVGIDPISKAEEQARLDREAFDALVELAKEYIKEGVKTAKEFFGEVSDTVDETLAKMAFNVAVKKEPAPNTKALQKAINKSVEGKASKASEKVNTSEYVLFKKQIKDFARGVREGAKAQRETATKVVEAIKDSVGKGVLSARQAAVLAKRAASVNFSSPKSVSNFVAYADKVFADADFADKVSTAKDLQSKAKDKLKSKSVPAGQKQLLADIVNTNIDLIEDLDTFNEVVSEYMRGFLPVTNKNYKVADANAVREYIDSVQPTQTEAQRRLEEEFNLSGLSEAEAEEVLAFMEQQDADTYQENLSESKQKTISDALSKVAEYSKIAISDFAKAVSGLSNKKKAVLDSLLGADISMLSNAQKAAYVKIVDNIVTNNDWSASGALAAEMAGQQAAQDFNAASVINTVREIGGVFGSVGRFVAEQSFGVSAMFRTIYGLGKAMVDVQSAMGLSEYLRKFYAYRNEIEDILDFVVRFQKDSTKKYKDFNDSENRTAEGMFAFAVQPMEGVENSLEARKKIIEQDIEAKRNSGNKELVKEAETASVVYDKLFNGAKTVDDVIANMKKNYEGNFKFWEFISKTVLPEHTETLEEYSVMDKNENIPYDIDNYTPISYSRLDGQEVEVSPEKQYQPPLKDIKNIGKASATKKRIDPKSLPKGKMINYDLRTGVMRSLSDSLFDAMLYGDIVKMNAFLGTSKATTIFGGMTNKNFVQEKINAVIKSQRGDFRSQSAGERVIRSMNTKLKKYGALRALGGFTQAIKQPVDIIVNSVFTQGFFNLGEGMRILATDKDVNKLLDKFSIGSRGGVKGGIVRKTLSQELAEKTRLMTPTNVNVFLSNMDDMMDVPLFALSKSDAAAAKASWLGYYVQYLKKEGVDVMDMAQESEAVLSDPIRAKAAVYAETMVDIYQVESETSKMAEFAKTGSKSLLADVVKNVLMPFSTFSVGQRVRINADLRDIFMGRNTGLAAKSLIGTTMAIGTFHATSVYIISMIKDAGAYALNALLGGDDEDDDITPMIAFTSTMEALYTLGLNDADLYRIAKQAQKQALQGKESDVVQRANAAFKFKKLYSSISRDMIASGYSSFAEESFIDAMNGAVYLYLAKLNDPSVLKKDGELMKYESWIKNSDTPFYRYQNKDRSIPFIPSNVGIYDVITDRPFDVYEQVNIVLDPEAAKKEAQEQYKENEKRAAKRLGEEEPADTGGIKFKEVKFKDVKFKDVKFKEVKTK